MNRLSRPRSSRLLTQKDFERVFKQGKRRRSESITVVAGPVGEGCETSRLGLVASRKVGKAHARNRLKRVIREIFRLHILPSENRVDLVVRFFPGAGKTPSRKVRDEFLESAEKLGFYSPRSEHG